MPAERGAWVDFWFRPLDPAALGLCRVVFYGLWWVLYGTEDFTFVARLGALQWEPIALVRGLAADTAPSEAWLQAGQLVWKVSLVTSLLGLGTRLSTAIAALGGLWLLGLTYSVGRVSHETAAAALMLVVMAVARPGDTLSVDALLRRGSGPVPPSAEYRWPVQLGRVLVCTVFFAAGANKLRESGLAWVTSPHLQLTLGLRDSPVALWLAGFPWLCHVLAALTLVVELGHPLALWSRRLAAVFIPGSVALLLGFQVVMEVAFWPLLGLHVFWLPWDWLLARGARRNDGPSPSR